MNPINKQYVPSDLIPGLIVDVERVVLGFLDPIELAKCLAVNKVWARIIAEEAPAAVLLRNVFSSKRPPRQFLFNNDNDNLTLSAQANSTYLAFFQAHTQEFQYITLFALKDKKIVKKYKVSDESAFRLFEKTIVIATGKDIFIEKLSQKESESKESAQVIPLRRINTAGLVPVPQFFPKCAKFIYQEETGVLGFFGDFPFERAKVCLPDNTIFQVPVDRNPNVSWVRAPSMTIQGDTFSACTNYGINERFSYSKVETFSVRDQTKRYSIPQFSKPISKMVSTIQRIAIILQPSLESRVLSLFLANVADGTRINEMSLIEPLDPDWRYEECRLHLDFERLIVALDNGNTRIFNPIDGTILNNINGADLGIISVSNNIFALMQTYLFRSHLHLRKLTDSKDWKQSLTVANYVKAYLNSEIPYVKLNLDSENPNLVVCIERQNQSLQAMIWTKDLPEQVGRDYRVEPIFDPIDEQESVVVDLLAQGEMPPNRVIRPIGDAPAVVEEAVDNVEGGEVIIEIEDQDQIIDIEEDNEAVAEENPSLIQSIFSYFLGCFTSFWRRLQTLFNL